MDTIALLRQRALLRRLELINLLQLRALEKRNATADLCVRVHGSRETYAPHGPAGLPWDSVLWGERAWIG
jgi:hypothetical protein